MPVAGTVGDIFWRANMRNLALLERHARPGLPPREATTLFVFGIAALFGMLVARAGRAGDLAGERALFAAGPDSRELPMP